MTRDDCVILVFTTAIVGMLGGMFWFFGIGPHNFGEWFSGTVMFAIGWWCAKRLT